MRLMSYNIHKGIGGRDRRYDLDRIIRVIEHENPDVLCLQEVTRHARRTAGDDQPSRLQRSLGLPSIDYHMTVHYRRGGYGNLILSRWQIRERHHISLRLGIRKNRECQLAVIESPEGPFHCVNWHLGLWGSERRRQAERLVGHALFRSAIHHPTIVIGDSNDWSNALAAQPFAALGFTDATAPASRFRSFPAFLPAFALDKAFCRGVTIREARLSRTPLSHRASDHLPLIVDFHIPSHIPSLNPSPLSSPSPAARH